MVTVAPVVSPGPVARVVLAAMVMWVWPGPRLERPVKTVVMPVTVPPVGLAVMVESVVLQEDPPVSPVRTRTAVPAVSAVRVDSAVTAALVRPVLRAAPALSPAVTAVPAVRVLPGVVAARVVRAVSR